MAVKLLLVDGPTGSGKDYFIENLVKELKEKNPKLSILQWRATDFVLKDKSLSEKRKYVIHDIDPERLDIIFNGHKELIKAAVTTLTDKEKPVDLIIVNRSILTMLGTNLWKDSYLSTREIFSKEFSEFTKPLLDEADINSLFIRIDVDTPGTTRAVNILLSRIASRADNMSVDVEWFYTILRTYRRDHDLASLSFTYNDTFNSGESSVAINRYLKPLIAKCF